MPLWLSFKSSGSDIIKEDFASDSQTHVGSFSFLLVTTTLSATKYAE